MSKETRKLMESYKEDQHTFPNIPSEYYKHHCVVVYLKALINNIPEDTKYDNRAIY